MKPVLAVDMGGTRIKLGVVAEGKILARDAVDAHSGRGLAAGLPGIAAALCALCRTCGVVPESCAGLAVSFPSLMDPVSSCILATYGKYEDAPSLDLADWALREFALRFAIENDARAALLGEWKYGAGRGYGDLAMITLGTGIGTAVLIGGKLLRGKHGQAGCLGGHFTVRHGGRACSCGNVGCVEAEASTAFLQKIALDFQECADPVVRDGITDYREVFESAAAGDACALRIRDHSLQVWGSLAVNLIHAYDPEVVVLGGGLMRSRETILPRVTAYVDRHAHTPWGKVILRAAELGDDAALLGCGVLAEERFL